MNKKVQILAETIKRLLSCRADDNLKNILAKAHTADVAAVLEDLDVEDQAKIFSLLKDAAVQAEVLSKLSLANASPLLEKMGASAAAKILHDVSPDDLADILAALPSELSEAILLKLKKEDAEEVEELIRFAPDTAGGIMSPSVFSLLEETTIEEAIKKIQQDRDVETFFYAYVVNHQGHLVGVLSLKKLLLSLPQQQIGDVMEKDPVRIRIDEDQEEVARIVSRYDYLSVPVVDESNKLVGVITVDDVIDVIREEATEDILLMTGADKKAMTEDSFWKRLLKRLPWFSILLAEGILASEVVAYYFHGSLPMRVLVAFVPMILGLGSGVARQSTAIFLSTLREGGGLSKISSPVTREIFLTGLLGFFYGNLLGLFVHFRYGYGWGFLAVAGFLLMLVVILAALIGIFVPRMFRRVGIDPAFASSFATVFVHIFSLWAYFAWVRYWIM
ncbi:MAG: magnesium transporter [Deltaproteobacteria bacterium]|nr:magnesium transporter [Deltaproteobacteria bacterium]